MNNPTFASSVFGGGDPTAPSMQGPAAAYMSNQNATYQSSVFKDPSPQTCREDYRGYVRDQDRAASELLSSDGHAAPCHRRKPFVSTKYQSNISRLGADELPDVEPRLDRHLVSDGVRGSLRGPVASSQYPTSYSEDPNSAIYPNASACQHKKRSVAHNKTPYAHSEEFNILKQEVRCFNDGPGQAPGAVAVGGSRAQGSTYLGAEKVPRKNYQVMVHQQPLRGDYARQVIGRYEQVPTAAVDHSQLFN
eukprot:g3055.t1